MKIHRLTALLITAAALCLGACAGTDSDHASGTSGAATTDAVAAAREMPSEEEMHAAWMTYMTPSEEHARMAEDVGEWNVAGKMWMAPDAPPVEVIGSAKIRMTFDGRYQIQEYESAMPMGPGQPDFPFQGMSLTGYDNETHEFTSVWIDSMGTGTLITRGTRNAAGDVTTTGDMVMPSIGKGSTRMVTRRAGKDSFVFEMYMTSALAPDECKSVELTYSRAK
jgi:hypothetical protein